MPDTGSVPRRATIATDPSPRIALIGASGWLGRSIGPSLLRAGIVGPAGLICVNRSGPSIHYAAWPELHWETDADAAIAGADLVLLSIRPQDFRSGRFDCTSRLVISLMAGITCAEIATTTGARGIVRAMPNAAVEIERSYSPWFASGDVTVSEKWFVESLLACVGTTGELGREDELDVLTAISGAGPAYAALLSGALIEAGRKAGLSEEVAALAAQAVVCDAAMLLRGRIDQAAAIVETFVAYRGTTAEVLTAARKAGFDNSVLEAVEAGTRKARELGRNAVSIRAGASSRRTTARTRRRPTR